MKKTVIYLIKVWIVVIRQPDQYVDHARMVTKEMEIHAFMIYAKIIHAIQVIKVSIGQYKITNYFMTYTRT